MITILDHDFSQLNIFLQKNNYTKLFILVDENTHEYCLPLLLGNLETDLPFEILEIEAGEEMKNIQTANQLWEILTEMKADRKSLMINLGGGVITDLGGFVASTFKRGIEFINIPTSLLAMCDASIGGKTGIDLMHYKNMVGTFSFPKEIFIFNQFLKTLSFKELRSGFAEMLKHGLVADNKHWEDLISLSELDANLVSQYIQTSMKIKQNIVDIDFKEQNIRKTLNFGHTIGHAIESLFLEKGKPILHGEAVACGMICETQIAYLENILTENDKNSIIKNIRRFYPTLNIDIFNNTEILNLLLNDKKNDHDKINFSLITSIGSCCFDYQPSEKNILESLEYYKNLSSQF